MRSIFTGLIIVVAACGSPTALPTGAEPPGDPCALLSVAEVERATGSVVLRSGLVPDERRVLPGGPDLCEYVTDGRHGSIPDVG